MKISNKAKSELLKLRSEKLKDPTKTLKIVTFPLWQGEGDFGMVIQERFDTDIIIKDEEDQNFCLLMLIFQKQLKKLR
jgi:hypothetical protein